MIRLAEIKQAYPAALHGYDEFLLREYLQYRMLGIIYASPWAEKLVFLGGTCLRIVHNNRRFSEDLDFDNRGIEREEFAQVGALVQRELEKEGYAVTTTMAGLTAMRCKVKLPGLLFAHGLSGHREQSVLIQMDTESQRFEYEAEPFILDRWEVRQTIKCCPLPLLCAQKCHAILDRKRSKGRDYFDVAFLLGLRVEPDLDYVRERIGLGSKKELAEALIARANSMDLEALIPDAQGFLFDANGTSSIRHFAQLVKQTWLK